MNKFKYTVILTILTLTIISTAYADDHGDSWSTSTVINIDEVVNGEIDPGTDEDYFKIHFDSGIDYEIHLGLGSLTDTKLWLYNTDGTTQLGYNDDDPQGGFDSRIYYTCLAQGDYYIKAGSYSTNVGTYTLTVSSSEAPDTTVRSKRHFNSYPEIDSIDFESNFHGYQSAVDRDWTGGDRAYDYSAHVIYDVTEGLYRIYAGGRWRESGGAIDGDHMLRYESETGVGNSWSMATGPEFPQGKDDGYPDLWFRHNYMDPEIMKVDGTYYCYTEAQIDPGDPVDYPTGAVNEFTSEIARIQLHTSTDGVNWNRWSTQRGVITNIAQPTLTHTHHHEALYVPWDADGKPFWLYFAIAIDGTQSGYHRIRSADPTTFDWNTKEVANLAQLGNQIGYIEDAPGGPLFIRITFTNEKNNTSRTVPSFQFSRNGLQWIIADEGAVELAGSDESKNCYFLGFSTIDGKGQLQSAGEDNTYKAVYVATTSQTPMAPEIYYSELGCGEVTLKINPESTFAGDIDKNGISDLGDVAILAQQWQETRTQSVIAITNGSFEDPTLTDGQWHSSVVDWPNIGVAGEDAKTYRPVNPYNATDGANIFYAGSSNAGVYQTLAATIEANSTYKLQIDVFGIGSTAWCYSAIQSIAGGDLAIAGKLGVTMSQPLYQWNTMTCTFNSNDVPDHIGKNMQILIWGMDVMVDNVRLYKITDNLISDIDGDLDVDLQDLSLIVTDWLEEESWH